MAGTVMTACGAVAVLPGPASVSARRRRAAAPMPLSPFEDEPPLVSAVLPLCESAAELASLDDAVADILCRRADARARHVRLGHRALDSPSRQIAQSALDGREPERALSPSPGSPVSPGARRAQSVPLEPRLISSRELAAREASMDAGTADWSYVSQRVRTRVRLTAKEFQTTAIVQLQQIWDRKTREALELWATSHEPPGRATAHVLTGSGAKWNRRVHLLKKPSLASARSPGLTLAAMLRPRELGEVAAEAAAGNRTGDLLSPEAATAQSEALRALNFGAHADPIVEALARLDHELDSVVSTVLRSGSQMRLRSRSRSRVIASNPSLSELDGSTDSKRLQRGRSRYFVASGSTTSLARVGGSPDGLSRAASLARSREARLSSQLSAARLGEGLQSITHGEVSGGAGPHAG